MALGGRLQREPGNDQPDEHAEDQSDTPDPVQHLEEPGKVLEDQDPEDDAAAICRMRIMDRCCCRAARPIGLPSRRASLLTSL